MVRANKYRITIWKGGGKKKRKKSYYKERFFKGEFLAYLAYS